MILGALLGFSNALACERSDPPQSEACGPSCREALQRAIREVPEPPVDPIPPCAPGARTTLIYGDPEKPPLRKEMDCNLDGRPDRWIKFAPDGSESEIEIDTNFDGIIDVRMPLSTPEKPEAK